MRKYRKPYSNLFVQEKLFLIFPNLLLLFADNEGKRDKFSAEWRPHGVHSHKSATIDRQEAT